MELAMTSLTRCRHSVAGSMLLAMLVAASTTPTTFAQSSGESVPWEISEAVGRAMDLGDSSSGATAEGFAENSPPLRLNAPSDASTMSEPVTLPQQTAGQYVPPGIGEMSAQPAPCYETVDVGPSVGPLESFDAVCECNDGDTIGPRSPRGVCGFHCIGGGCDGPVPGLCAWKTAGPIPFQAFAQGDYIGQARTPHVPEYRLRVDDVLDFVFRITGEASANEYQLQIGDVLRVESLGAPEQNRDQVIVQPDGYITLAIVGSVRTAGRTISELTDDLNQRYSKEIKGPGITISPVSVNTVLEEFRNTVDNRGGVGGGQSRRARVTPAGTVQLPAIGSVHAQGLTLTELQREIEAAYSNIVVGLGVTPILEERAPRFIYVVGEVDTPGRFTLEGPTTAMQAVALAGSWSVGANLRQVIIFRRDDQWNLMAARINLQGALRGNDPCPAGEIWLRDSDIVLVPPRQIKLIDDAIELIFTRGIYSVLPVIFTDNLALL